MKHINQFYKTYLNENEKNEFDIKNLGDTIYYPPPIAFVYKRGISQHGGGYREVKEEDYDNEFISLLFSIRPIYKIEDCLSHHYSYYKESHDDDLFLKHIKYVVHPNFKNNEEVYKLIDEWVIKQKSMFLQRQQNEKDAFLLRAYEEALNYSPGSPYSVQINPIGLGEAMGYDANTTRRIVNELRAEELVTITIGMANMSITNEGVRYLKSIHIPQKETMSSAINISVGSNSNVQFQQNTNNSNQTQQVENVNSAELNQFIKDINNNIEALKTYLSPKEIETLSEDIEYIAKHQDNSSKRGILNSMWSGVKEIVKAVPSNVIANILTNPQILHSVGIM